eukprot:CAMPEP_0178422040 /NCGR_PEP_ID=MMETSP0689_2-20121128/26965_1 /TAXON_ID=160604 /ORGANISM="Amphidinium massartii, Strain CS-259" /LENGTH=224 /DNA_ID=CAMNT_0020043585 /DNA_START=26 /DNA_END=696 /DNA_ORIENTATION=-
MSAGAVAAASRGTKDSKTDRDGLRPAEPRRCKVVVASSARVKVAAVERIFKQCTVEGLQVQQRVSRGQSSQEEALRGIAEGIEAAKTKRPGADYYVAMENSVCAALVDEGSQQPEAQSGKGESANVAADSRQRVLRHFDIGWVMVERSFTSTGSGGRLVVPMRAVAASAGVELPFGETSTESIAEKVGLLDVQNAHSWLTAGRRSRIELLSEAVAVALGQLERA